MGRIILIGGNGDIGLTLVESLGEKYSFEVLDINIDRTVAHCKSSIVDASSYDQLRAHDFNDVDCIVNLTSVPTTSDIMHPEDCPDVLYGTFLKCVYNVLFIAKENRVSKVVNCSTNHVTGLLEKDGFSLKENGEPITINDPLCPEGMYGALKAAGELLTNAFSSIYGLQVFNIRIGTYRYDNVNKDKFDRYSRTWLSRKDLILIFDALFRSKLAGAHTYYCVSDNNNCPWDRSNMLRDLNI